MPWKISVLTNDSVFGPSYDDRRLHADLYRDWSLDHRVGVVSDELKVFVRELKNILHLGVDSHCRE